MFRRHLGAGGAVFIGSVLVLAAAIAMDTASRAASAASAREVVVTRSGASLPSGCSPRTLAALIDQLFDAFNGGEWDKVDSLFAAAGPGPNDFKLLSWQREVVQERERLVAYLGELRTRGERFRVLALRASKVSRVATSVGITYVFERPAGLGIGKGLIECGLQKIWQWAMNPKSGRPPPPCPQPAGWSTTGPIVACTDGPNARALAIGFRLEATSIALPKKCRPAAVKRRVAAALGDFNLGRGDAFARHFLPRGEFHPYTASIAGASLVGRAHIARFVSGRYRAGDGWTALRLLPPLGSAGLPTSAVYGVTLKITHQRAPFADEAGAKLVIDCSTGLLQRLVGPSLVLPGS